MISQFIFIKNFSIKIELKTIVFGHFHSIFLNFQINESRNTRIFRIKRRTL